ncbi:hypothetical protein PV341_35390 [Streptomyces sp. PA03-1a]|nr:hypothetical protein [Streptomyces sp. PA03-1a]MDX2816508.1 hypothetical protein [Streptomyces sp. PA03-5A]
MHIAVFAEVPEAVGRTGSADVPGEEAGETGYTGVQELFDIARFAERMDRAWGPAVTDGRAAPPTGPLTTVPAMTDRAPVHDHPIPRPGRTLAELRERTRE